MKPLKELTSLRLPLRGFRLVYPSAKRERLPALLAACMILLVTLSTALTGPALAESQMLEKTLFCGDAGNQYYNLLQVMEKQELSDKKVLRAAITVTIRPLFVKVCPRPPKAIGISIVDPHGLTLAKQTSPPISPLYGWPGPTSVTLSINLPTPPSNTYVRVFVISWDDNIESFWNAAIYLNSGKWAAAKSKFLPREAMFVNHEKLYPRGALWPEDINAADLSLFEPKKKEDILAEQSDPQARPLWLRSSSSAPTEVRQALQSYLVVPVWMWEEYFREAAQVSTPQQDGELILKGRHYYWCLYPGGLAAVVYPDCGVVYLAQKVSRDN